MSEPGWVCFMWLRGGSVLTQLHVVWIFGSDGQSWRLSSGGHAVVIRATYGQTSDDNGVFFRFNPSCLRVSAPISSHQQGVFLSSPLVVIDGEPSITGHLQTFWEQTCPLLMPLNYWFGNLYFTPILFDSRKGLQPVCWMLSFNIYWIYI